MTSTVVHSSGTVVATCSGQRLVDDYGEVDSSSSENESDSEESEESDSDDASASSPYSSDGSPSISSSLSSRDSNGSANPTGRSPDNSIRVWGI